MRLNSFLCGTVSPLQDPVPRTQVKCANDMEMQPLPGTLTKEGPCAASQPSGQSIVPPTSSRSVPPTQHIMF